MASSKSLKPACADTLSVLTAPSALPPTSKKRIHDLSFHREKPLEFLRELRKTLKVVSSDEKYGIAWNKSGDQVLLSKPDLFQRLLLKSKDQSMNYHRRLAAFDETMRRLGFKTMPYKKPFSQDEFLPHMYMHNLFRKHSDLQELRWIVAQLKVRSPRKSTKAVCLARPPSAPKHDRLATLSNDAKKSGHFVTPDKKDNHRKSDSKIHSNMVKKGVNDAKDSLAEICKASAKNAVANHLETKNGKGNSSQSAVSADTNQEKKFLKCANNSIEAEEKPEASIQNSKMASNNASFVAKSQRNPPSVVNSRDTKTTDNSIDPMFVSEKPAIIDKNPVMEPTKTESESESQSTIKSTGKPKYITKAFTNLNSNIPVDTSEQESGLDATHLTAHSDDNAIVGHTGADRSSAGSNKATEEANDASKTFVNLRFTMMQWQCTWQTY